MKGAILIEPKKLVIKYDLDIPKPKHGEVLVRIKACGVCPTDVKKYTGLSPLPKFPFILGHEAAGTIEKLGEGVSSDAYKIGDRVVLGNALTCGNCKKCKNGALEYLGVAACENNEVYGVTIDGVFTEYASVPVDLIHKIPNQLSFNEAALVEPVACCLNGIEKAEIKLAETVFIIGAGFMGLVSLQLAKLKGARVVISDIIDERLEIAKSLGADIVINPKNVNLEEEILKYNNGEDVDVIISSIGGQIAFDQGMKVMGVGSRMVLLGGTYPITKFEFDPNKIHYDQSIITGTVSYTKSGFVQSIKLLADKKISAEVLQSELIDLEDLEEAFNDVLNTKGLRKCVIFD